MKGGDPATFHNFSRFFRWRQIFGVKFFKLHLREIGSMISSLDGLIVIFIRLTNIFDYLMHLGMSVKMFVDFICPRL